jgi:hypothetical protein
MARSGSLALASHRLNHLDPNWTRGFRVVILMVIVNAVIYDNRCRGRSPSIVAGRAPFVTAGRHVKPFVGIIWSSWGSLIAGFGSATVPEMDIDIVPVVVAGPVTHLELYEGKRNLFRKLMGMKQGDYGSRKGS